MTCTCGHPYSSHTGFGCYECHCDGFVEDRQGGLFGMFLKRESRVRDSRPTVDECARLENQTRQSVPRKRTTDIAVSGAGVCRAGIRGNQLDHDISGRGVVRATRRWLIRQEACAPVSFSQNQR